MDLGKTASDALSGALGGMSLGPFGMIAGALISAVPDLIGAFAPHLAGPQSEAVSQAVVQAVSAATGVAQPKPADIAALPPDQKTALQVQLAQIAMQAEANRLADEKDARDTEMAKLQAALLDTQSARTQTVSLAQAHSPLQYGAIVVSVIVLTAFGGTLYAVLTHAVAPESAQLVNILLGSLSTMASTVVGFWVGNSSSSQAKDNYIANSVPIEAHQSAVAAAAKAPAPPLAQAAGAHK